MTSPTKMAMSGRLLLASLILIALVSSAILELAVGGVHNLSRTGTVLGLQQGFP